MVIRRSLRGVAILLLAASVMVPQTLDPAGLWRILKDMLSAPNGQVAFAGTLKDAVPAGRGQLAPYLEGSLVSITPGSTGSRRLLLSMEGGAIADVTIVLRGPNTRLKTEPKKGTLIQFDGVVREFTKEPFMLTFDAEHVSGLDFVNPR